MCEPISMSAASGLAIAQGAVSAGQGILGFMGSKRQADATNRNSYWTAVMNNLALAQSYNHLNQERSDAREAASGQLFNDRLKAIEAEHTAVTAGGEAGVDGSASLDALRQTYHLKEGMLETGIARNYRATSDNIQARAEAMQNGTIARNNALPRVEAPNFADAALRILGGGLTAAGNYFSMTRSSNRATTQASGTV